MSAVFGLSEEQKQQARAEARVEQWVALLRSSKPVVAAVNGAAIGVGVSLILPADQILAAPQAKFSLRFVKMGVVPEFAASHFAERRIGFGAASRLLLTGEDLSAEEAHALKLIDGVVPAEHFVEEATALARRMGTNPAHGVAYLQAIADRERPASRPGTGAAARTRGAVALLRIRRAQGSSSRFPVQARTGLQGGKSRAKPLAHS